MNGSIVSMIAQVARMVLTILSTVVLARLLQPTDFGLLAMATTVTGFIGMFTDMGLSTPTVQRPVLSQAMVSTLFFLNVITGVALALIGMATAPIAAALFSDGRVTNAVLLLSLSIPLAAAGAQHNALLTRSMRWIPAQFSGLFGQVVALIVAIIAVTVWHIGYWALLIQPIIATAISTALLWFFSGWRPSLIFDLGGTRSEIHFGAGLTGFQLVNYFHRQLDNIVVGWWWGTAPLGLYSRGYNIFASIQAMCSWPVTGVLLPLLSRTRHDADYYNRNLLDAVAAVALLNGLLGCLLICLSDNIIYFLLGKQWAESATVFKYLAPTILISGNAVFGTVFTARGDTRGLMISAIVNTLGFATGFLIAVPHGIAAVAAAYSIISLFAWPVTVHLALSRESLSQSRYYSVTVPILAASLAIISCFTAMFETRFGPISLAQFVLRGTLIAVSYGLLALLLSQVFPELRTFRGRLLGWLQHLLDSRKLRLLSPGASRE
ncbi:lipopolysaccharide biosynthesis protein [Sphingobium nicotianae]|uniref:Lipopolysaccharide biosynthesis protein n=1 Tax=Sphingobium nicotianae TaxID=2782607 RepID=A0A9X1ISL7_9SPHN|nr:lipopolysaccharide biosynthesis protein [Sphingobium nicotianae]MBT2188502.1 lipopolysaccharide biosynthesis protein [Sphingobium nicotianae]